MRLAFTLAGVELDEAQRLVERFKRRRPLYGSVAVATPDVRVEVEVVP